MHLLVVQYSFVRAWMGEIEDFELAKGVNKVKVCIIKWIVAGGWG